MFHTMLENLRHCCPLIHNITNYVTVNDCANILLACGGSPIMADAIGEAADITAICGGLNINIGTLNERTIPAMLAAGKRAQEVGLLVQSHKDSLIAPWAQELTEREGFSPDVVKELAAREESVQRRLLADYQRDGLTPKQFERMLSYDAPKTDTDIEHALDQVIKTLRDISAWRKKYGAAVDMYRVEHIRTQLDKLTNRE